MQSVTTSNGARQEDEAATVESAPRTLHFVKPVDAALNIEIGAPVACGCIESGEFGDDVELDVTIHRFVELDLGGRETRLTINAATELRDALATAVDAWHVSPMPAAEFGYEAAYKHGPKAREAQGRRTDLIEPSVRANEKSRLAFDTREVVARQSMVIPAPPCTSFCTEKHAGPGGWDEVGLQATTKLCAVDIPVGGLDADEAVRLSQWWGIADDGAIRGEGPRIECPAIGPADAQQTLALAAALGKAAELVSK